jgi:hypothetical protein
MQELKELRKIKEEFLKAQAQKGLDMDTRTEVVEENN